MDHFTKQREVKTFKDFEQLIIRGSTQFVVQYARSDGFIFIEYAPFDSTDPMSYILAAWFLKQKIGKIFVKL